MIVLQISSELESIKAEMDERGTTMTDAGNYANSIIILPLLL